MFFWQFDEKMTGNLQNEPKTAFLLKEIYILLSRKRIWRFWKVEVREREPKGRLGQSGNEGAGTTQSGAIGNRQLGNRQTGVPGTSCGGSWAPGCGREAAGRPGPGTDERKAGRELDRGGSGKTGGPSWEGHRGRTAHTPTTPDYFILG